MAMVPVPVSILDHGRVDNAKHCIPHLHRTPMPLLWCAHTILCVHAILTHPNLTHPNLTHPKLTHPNYLPPFSLHTPVHHSVPTDRQANDGSATIITAELPLSAYVNRHRDHQ